MALLRISGLSVDIPTETGMLSAVRGVDLQVDRQECLGLVGESGSGKSLTALSILGLLPRRARRSVEHLSFDGQDLTGFDDTRLAMEVRGRRVGFIFQEPMTSLNPVMSIGDQLTETMTIHGTADRAGARKRAVALLDRVGLSDAERRLGQFPHQFSGGQRQRVMIAMALMNTPDLLIADEPTTALDVTIQAQIIDLLDELRHEMGLALILISHNLGLVSRIADRVSVMYAGEMVEAAPARALFETPRHPYTCGLLASAPEANERAPQSILGAMKGRVPSLFAPPTACTFEPRCPRAAPPCAAAHPALTEDGERAFRCLFPVRPGDPPPFASGEAAPTRKAPGTASRPVLTVAGLTKTYAGRSGPIEAVRGVEFSLLQGETLALVGESGCGKSTVARMLVGLETPTSGRITLESGTHDDQRARARRIQLVFQDPYSSLNPLWSVHELVRRPLDVHSLGSPTERDARVDRLLDQMSMPRRLRRARVDELSGGQRQRVAIARALVIEPDILVCDEPTSALDVSVQAQILNLLLDLRNTFNISLILISHDLSVVGHMADRVMVMHQGRIIESGSAQAVLHNPSEAYTRALVAATPRLHPA
ncbi:MAG: ABC transporter ATP-binding protein [Brevundimonas sp.]|nr:ABC transporter ATP-binding protein [Brevundimonas sp.]MDZ4060705.1 ABC transporter ATP-binding protein [Brevundimonas sp.]